MASAVVMVACLGCGASAADPPGASGLPPSGVAEPSPDAPPDTSSSGGSSSQAPGDPPPVDAAAPALAGRDCIPDDSNASGVGGWITLMTQWKLDRLAGCSRILGSLSVTSDVSLDLTALSSLRVVEGSLYIQPSAYDAQVRRRQSLHGLEGLQTVGALSLVSIEGGLGPLSGISGEVASVSLSDIPGLSDLRSLGGFTITRQLQLDSMPDLQSLDGVSLATVLEDGLSFSNNPRLEDLSGLGALTQVGGLSLHEHPSLRRLSLPESLVSLHYFSIQACPLLTSLSELSRFTTIEGLHVGSMPNLVDLGGGGSQEGSLRDLGVGSCPALTEIAPVGGLSSLIRVDIGDCAGVTDLDGLAASAALQSLTISNNAALTHLPVFERVEGQMENVRVRDNPVLVTGPSFPHLRALHNPESLFYESAELSIVGNLALERLGDFPELRSASMVTIVNNPALGNVTLPGLESLTFLRVRDNAGLTSLDLGVEEKLVRVELVNNPALTDLALGTSTERLVSLELHGNTALPSESQQGLLGRAGPDAVLTLE